jgi:MFS family permease
LAGLLGCVLAPLSGALLWAVILGLGQGASFALALTLIVLRSADARTAGQLLELMAQGVGYCLAAAGPLLVGVLHSWTGSWSALAGLFLVIGMAPWSRSRRRANAPCHLGNARLVTAAPAQILRAGLMRRTPTRMAIVMMPGTTASQVPAAARAPVAAHPTEDKASAKVAMRDEVWRRRKWLRLAWVRNQSWMAVAEAVAGEDTDGRDQGGERRGDASATTKGAKTRRWRHHGPRSSRAGS